MHTITKAQSLQVHEMDSGDEGKQKKFKRPDTDEDESDGIPQFRVGQKISIISDKKEPMAHGYCVIDTHTYTQTFILQGGYG